MNDTWLYQDDGDIRRWARWIGLIVLIIGLTTGCASSSTVLAKASNPSPAVMGTAEACLERSSKIFGSTDKAATYCLAMRDKEVARDTTTADKAAKAEEARSKGRVNSVGLWGNPAMMGGFPMMGAWGIPPLDQIFRPDGSMAARRVPRCTGLPPC